MNPRRRKTHSVSFQYWGWTARPFFLGLTVAGEVFALISPFIERGYRNVDQFKFHIKSSNFSIK
jgi:hypothetical protein